MPQSTKVPRALGCYRSRTPSCRLNQMRPRVAIIGGGPAGCSAAGALVPFDCDVILFEAAGRFRDKPCGDALVSRAVADLMQMGISSEDLVRAGGRPFSEVRLSSCDGSRQVALEHPGGWVIPRAQLDQVMRDRVSRGCKVNYQSAVRSVVPTSAGRLRLVLEGRVAEDLSFDAVIVATGASRSIARDYDIDGGPLPAISFRAYLRVERADPCLLFEFLSRPGYVWHFPVAGDLINVGVCSLGISATAVVRNELNSQIRKTLSVPVGRVSGGVGPLWTGNSTQWHHGIGLVSCGDAAGLVDPMTGEGISAALRSGALAGEAIGHFVRGSMDGGILAHYSAQILAYCTGRYAPNPLRVLFADLLGPVNTPAGTSSR